VAVSFIGGGNWSTERKPLTCHKSLTNFYHIMLNTLSWMGFKLTIFVMEHLLEADIKQNLKGCLCNLYSQYIVGIFLWGDVVLVMIFLPCIPTDYINSSDKFSYFD
jgi:hypothetical protein